MLFFIADVHAGSRLRPSPEFDKDWRIGLQYCVQTILKLAEKHDKNVCCIAGDLLDAAAVTQDISVPVQVMLRQLTDADVQLVAIAGNHDITRQRHLIEPLGGVHLTLDNPFIEVEAPEKVRIFGCPYTDTKTLLEMLQKAKEAKPDVLLVHAAFRHSLGFEGAYQLTLEAVDGIAPIIVAGHVHASSVTKAQQSTVFVSGSVIPCNVTENGARYILHCETPDPDKMHRTSIPVRRVGSILAEDFEKFRDQVEEKWVSIPDTQLLPFFVLRVPPDATEEAKQQTQVWSEMRKGLFEVVPFDAGASEQAMPVTTGCALTDTLGLVCNPETHPEAYKLLHQLLTNPDRSKDIVDTWAAQLCGFGGQNR